MIIPDVNLLLYAYQSDSPFHIKASNWWSELLGGEETIGLAPIVVFGFVRIGTNARTFRFPMTPQEAADHIREWLSQPCVQ